MLNNRSIAIHHWDRFMGRNGDCIAELVYEEFLRSGYWFFMNDQSLPVHGGGPPFDVLAKLETEGMGQGGRVRVTLEQRRAC